MIGNNNRQYLNPFSEEKLNNPEFMRKQAQNDFYRLMHNGISSPRYVEMAANLSSKCTDIGYIENDSMNSVNTITAVNFYGSSVRSSEIYSDTLSRTTNLGVSHR